VDLEQLDLEKPREIQALPCLQSQHKSAFVSISAAVAVRRKARRMRRWPDLLHKVRACARAARTSARQGPTAAKTSGHLRAQRI
jgi:hypothetical protein